jgi:hypothetical protein
MSRQPSTKPDPLDATDAHGFMTVFRPSSPMDVRAFGRILSEHRPYFLDLLTRRGVLLFRGFTPPTPAEFHDIVTGSLGLDAWNAFNTKRVPGFAVSLLRKYSERLLGAGDYRRYLDKDTVQLGPAEAAVQGPHVEGGGSTERSRHIALCCFEPAARLAETGMVDLHRVYEELPAALRAKYDGAWNRFSYVTQRKVNVLDRLIVAQSPLRVTVRQDGRAQLVLPLCPTVCAVPETGERCIQPWAFARNTNPSVQAAAIAAFPGRGELGRDSTAEGMNLTWELCDESGAPLEWSEAEQRALFDAIFERAFLMEWQRGDIAIVDNVRIGHWRMNGEQGARKLVQIQTRPFKADLYGPGRAFTYASPAGS